MEERNKRRSSPDKRDWPVTIFWLLIVLVSLVVWTTTQQWWAGMLVFVLGLAAFGIWAKRSGRLDRVK